MLRKVFSSSKAFEFKILLICCLFYLFIYLFIYSFIYLFIHLFIYLFIFLFICLFIYLCISCIGNYTSSTAYQVLVVHLSNYQILLVHWKLNESFPSTFTFLWLFGLSPRYLIAKKCFKQIIVNGTFLK